ncbi:hypothetical protein H0H87_003989 [Tephrocybe sp. NHM501043]|nr:hypothetical protein H0H87_003989 [Tephrocybe sp. NHM501043]
MRFKVSAPASELVAANAAGAGTGTLGINVLFHGDGGQSFFDFPNQGVNNGLMGVALLSPDPQLRWGGFDPQDQTGLVRPDGVAHSFMLPAFGASLGVPGAVLGCGGLEPQVAVQGDLSNVRFHWQSTTDELPDLQTSIPQAIAAYEQLAVDAGLSDAQIGQLQTADASPIGGHCEFDEKDFVSGVQLLTDNYGTIINGNAALNGVTVTNDVVGNEDLFGTAANGAQLNNVNTKSVSGSGAVSTKERLAAK